MCTQKLKIINPKMKSEHSTFNKYYDPLFLRVPCGKCMECQQMRKQEWIIRLTKEYEYTKAIGGFVYKDMFTYREQDVPRWHGLMTFNKEHYTAFAKKLRTYLERYYEKKKSKWNGELNFKEPRKGIVMKDDSPVYNEEVDIKNLNGKKTKEWEERHPKGKVKIFWVSEFGGEYNRPHYHAIFFVQYKISPWIFAHYVHKAWIHGFTSNKPLQENIVNGVAAIGYVTKYLCKDIEFAKVLTQQKNSTFITYIENQWKKLYNEPFDKEHFAEYPCETIKKILHELNMDNAIPFMRVSRYMGINALQSLTDEEIKNGELHILNPKKNGQTYSVISIPMYLKRKLYYDYKKEVKAWELNDKGKLLKILEEEKKIEKTIQELEEIFNQPLDKENHTEYGTIFKYGKEEKIAIDKTVCFKIYSDIKRNRNNYALLLNLINYRDTHVTNEIIRKVQAGWDYQSYIKDAMLKEWDNIDIFKEHKPHTHYLKMYERNAYTTWKSIISEATNDNRYKILLEVYDQIKTTRLLNKERYLIREHEAWVAQKNQQKRRK